MQGFQNFCILYMYFNLKNYLCRSIGESISTCKYLRVHFMIRITQFTNEDAVLLRFRSKIIRHAAVFQKARYFTSAFFLHRKSLEHMTLKRVSLHSGLESQNPAVTCKTTRVMFSRLPCLIIKQLKKPYYFFVALIFK